MENIKKDLISLVLVVAVIGVVFFVLMKPKEIKAPEESNTTTNEQNNNNTQKMELKIETLKEGTGEGAKNGDKVTVHYTGTLENGTKFDSSVDRGQPFTFTLGVGQVIEGWEKGILGMKVGEKRKLTIPSDMGYGQYGAGEMIPPNATLIFDVEMIGINQ